MELIDVSDKQKLADANRQSVERFAARFVQKAEQLNKDGDEKK